MNAMLTNPARENEPPVNRGGDDLNGPLSRRELFSQFRNGLLALTGATAAIGAAEMIAHPSNHQPAEVLTAGLPADYAAPSITFVHDARAYLGRDASGFYALDAVCPHLGCLVRHVNDSEHPGDGASFICPCHNSHYDNKGTLISGPAPRRLRYLMVELDSNGALVIHRDREAHPDDRLIA
jgi:Rieske Fe-S protein